MLYKHEGALREQAERFIKALARSGIEGGIVPGSFRDYLVKVSIQRAGQPFGHVNLYYSRKKDEFSLKTHELKDKAIIPDLEACWNGLSSPQNAVAIGAVAATRYQVYVDGSCLNDAIGYGVVVLKDGDPVAELFGLVQDKALQGMRQVGGELQAVYKAIEWCQANDVSEVALFYDYAGVEKWTTGEWQAKNPATQAYTAYMQDRAVVVRWQKVESHSSNRWNDRADQLAKLGAQQGAAGGNADQDPLAELGEKAGDFVGLLNECGIAAAYQGILNNQFARIVVSPERGCVDLYNTRKRPLSRPYLHGFSDSSLRERIEGLWQRFLSGHTEDSDRKEGFLKGATYYYEILKPYGDCALDFIDLASALDRACRQMRRRGINVESSRHDFEKLESIYKSLTGR